MVLTGLCESLRGQEPEAAVVPVQGVPGPISPAPRPQTAPPATPATPRTLPTTPGTARPPRVPATTQSVPPLGLASAGTSARPVELPTMYGDFQQFGSLSRGTASLQSRFDNSGRLPVPVIRGAYKISENEGPRPVDRAYLTYNFFYDVNPTQRQQIAGLPITNVHRETFGIEKAFLDGDASIGLRLPLLQLTGPTALDRATVGDLSVILKYALINEPFEPTADGTLQGGRVLSAGLVVTAPTGGAAAFTVQDPVIHPTLLQPFVGGIATYRRGYAQFISSIAVPTDDRDTTYMFNSLQVGYRLLVDASESRFVRSVTPIAELHVNTPFNNRDPAKLPIGASDIVSFTLGTSYGLGARSSLNLGVNVPVTGPRVYALETLVQLNVRY
jgi:hypothetical protein